MDIIDDHFYTIKESSKLTNIPERTLSRIGKRENARKVDGRYLFTGGQLKALIKRRELVKKKKQFSSPTFRHSPTQTSNDILQIISEIDNDNYVLIVLNAIKEDKHLEEFSEEEYNKFRTRINEADFLENRIKEYKEEIIRMEEYVLDYRNNIEYLKKSLDKRADETAIILKTIEQRNFINAKEKGFDKK